MSIPRALTAAFSVILFAAAVGAAAQQEPTPAPSPASSASAGEDLHPAVPGREVSFPASQVKDTFFAYVLGVIASGMPVDMDNASMRTVLVEFKSALNLPFDLITHVTQGPDPASGEQSLTLEFQHEVSIPVPFALLWYHPGSIVVSRTLAFDVRRSTWTDPLTGGEPAIAFDLALVHGSVLVDIDEWLKALFSSTLEDTWIQHIVFFQWSRDWMAMFEGVGRRSGRTRRAFFDLTKNEIRFPAPDSLYDAGRGFVP